MVVEAMLSYVRFNQIWFHFCPGNYNPHYLYGNLTFKLIFLFGHVAIFTKLLVPHFLFRQRPIVRFSGNFIIFFIVLCLGEIFLGKLYCVLKDEFDSQKIALCLERANVSQEIILCLIRTNLCLERLCCAS